MKSTSNSSKDSNQNETPSDRKSSNADLQDSPRDRDRLKPEETTIDLPEVKDIPGQEHIHVLPLGELADTTISSDDEEGAGILDNLNDEENDEDDTDIRMGTDSDVTLIDRKILAGSDSRCGADEDTLKRASLDSTDFEGDALNENSFRQEQTGADLDIPGGEADDANENIGEEDEENNSYSLGSDSNDRVVEGTP